MILRDAIAMINRMRADGVISSYAIGGAVGAAFYLEPVTTLDMDVFVAFQAGEGGFLDLKPIYDYLKSRGGVVEREYIVIAGWPVQFLPPGTPLVDEALAMAVTRDIDGEPVRVFTPEHLAAIALQVGRSKDKIRLAQFVEERALDRRKFNAILARHQLSTRWREFERKYLRDGK